MSLLVSLLAQAQTPPAEACQERVSAEIARLVEADEGGILALQFKVTTLKMTKKLLGTPHKTLEAYLKGESARLSALNVEDPAILSRLQALYRLESGDPKNAELQARIKSFQDKAPTLNYFQVAKRLDNKDISAYLLSERLSTPDSEFTEEDVAITWFMQRASDRLSTTPGVGSAAHNLTRLSTQLAIRSGAVGRPGLSAEQIQTRLSADEAALNAALDQLATRMKSAFPDCFEDRAVDSNYMRGLLNQFMLFGSVSVDPRTCPGPVTIEDPVADPVPDVEAIPVPDQFPTPVPEIEPVAPVPVPDTQAVPVPDVIPTPVPTPDPVAPLPVPDTEAVPVPDVIPTPVPQPDASASGRDIIARYALTSAAMDLSNPNNPYLAFTPRSFAADANSGPPREKGGNTTKCDYFERAPLLGRDRVMYCSPRSGGPVDGFSFSTQKEQIVRTDSEGRETTNSTARGWSFEFDELARQNTSFTVYDQGRTHERTSQTYYSTFFVFPRTRVPSMVPKPDGGYTLTLATGEKVEYDAGGKITSGALSEAGLAGPRQRPNVNYQGSGLVIRFDQENPNYTPVAGSRRVEIRLGNRTCNKVTKTDLITVHSHSSEGFPDNTSFKYASDTDLDAFLRRKCGFGFLNQ